MTKKCCIPTCKIESDQPEGRKLTFHTVPKEMREKWTELLLLTFNVELKKYSYICSLHFEPDCFYYSGLCQNRRLKKGSCPTLFGNSEYKTLKNESIQLDLQSESINVIDNYVEDDSTFNIMEGSSASSSVTADFDSDNKRSGKLENSSVICKERSILHMNVDSLNITEDAKEIIKIAKEEIIGLRRRNHQLQMKLYRSRKGVKDVKSLLSCMKKRKFISENLHKILKVSNCARNNSTHRLLK